MVLTFSWCCNHDRDPVPDIFITRNKTLRPQAAGHLPPPAPSNHESTFCLYGCALFQIYATIRVLKRVHSNLFVKDKKGQQRPHTAAFMWRNVCKIHNVHPVQSSELYQASPPHLCGNQDQELEHFPRAC